MRLQPRPDHAPRQSEIHRCASRRLAAIARAERVASAAHPTRLQPSCCVQSATRERALASDTGPVLVAGDINLLVEGLGESSALGTAGETKVQLPFAPAWSRTDARLFEQVGVRGQARHPAAFVA
eukprot:681627-Alexandrium_andersonii.AAC.1